MGASVEQFHSYSRGARVDYTWSARFALQYPASLEDIVANRLSAVVARFADPQWPVSGVVLGAGNAEDRTAVVLGLDPSRNFGTPDIPRCEEIAATITKTLGWQRQPEELPEMRILLGRRIGYEKDSPAHSVDAVRRLAVARGCGDVALNEADVFSLRYIPQGGVRRHVEPGVIIAGTAGQLEALLHVAADMGQDRLVPEITGIETQVWQR